MMKAKSGGFVIVDVKGNWSDAVYDALSYGGQTTRLDRLSQSASARELDTDLLGAEMVEFDAS